ncbi:MAG: hypothetical protein WC326_15740 [Candidatus Delongbacteria bacterium]
MLDLQFQNETDHLLAVARGPFKMKDFEPQLAALVTRARQAGHSRILIDALQVTPPETTFQRHLLGVKFAEQLGDALRVAILFPQAQITRFTEEAAQSHGAQLLVTGDRDQAEAWLRRA